MGNWSIVTRAPSGLLRTRMRRCIHPVCRPQLITVAVNTRTRTIAEQPGPRDSVSPDRGNGDGEQGTDKRVTPVPGTVEKRAGDYRNRPAWWPDGNKRETDLGDLVAVLLLSPGTRDGIQSNSGKLLGETPDLATRGFNFGKSGN